MATAYELYNDASNNVVGAYPTKETALAIVQRVYESRGLEGVRHLSLNVQDSLGRVRTIARGSRLITMVKARQRKEAAIA